MKKKQIRGKEKENKAQWISKQLHFDRLFHPSPHTSLRRTVPLCPFAEGGVSEPILPVEEKA